MSSIDYIAKCQRYRRYQVVASVCNIVAFGAAVVMSVRIRDGCDSFACVLAVLLTATLIGGVMIYTSVEPADCFHRDLPKDLKADYMLANPPLQRERLGCDRLREDIQWKFGVPPGGNANSAWTRHFLHHLAPRVWLVSSSPTAACPPTNPAKARLAKPSSKPTVDCMVALLGQLFYSTQIRSG
jgi:hypothetical protein